ncbi:MAG: ABC transporter ATP-binding protein, partial [Deltaproteobacteria bacterium]|nr:ABC transporter ATP-binding protein [Deltaproteobacteria bacterium]
MTEAMDRPQSAAKKESSDLILSALGMSMVFGGLVALNNVDLSIERDSITALIGPNGSGKTTFFNCVTGIYKPTRGEVILYPAIDLPSINLKGKPADLITHQGLARTFQNIRLFNNLTVLENVLIGRHTRMKAGLWGALIRNKKTRQEEAEAIEYSFDLLVTYGLDSMANELAKNLPYGDQRRLEIVRALATEPKVLLLDEPAAGLNISETAALRDLISDIRENEKVSILLIEHDMSLVMTV